MDVQARARAADERCPYCHDLADETLEEIECPACATRHHRACIQELGRCSVYGCEQPIDAGPVDDSRADESALMRQIRKRYRDRARKFVQKNTRGLREQIVDSLERGRRAERESNWEAAWEAYTDVAYLESKREARKDRTLATIEGRLSPAAARLLAAAMHRRHTQQTVLRVVAAVAFAGVVFVSLIVLLAVVAG